MLASKEFFMASRDQVAQFKNQVIAFAVLAIMVCTFAFPAQAYALGDPASIPNLPAFIDTVKDGNPNTLRGIYIEGVMAFAVNQQPMGNPGFVSDAADVVTQFSIASEVGNIGLLAHNHLAGAEFSQIQLEDTIILVYGDGHMQGFIVDDIQQFQALSPLSPYSNFRDLETEATITAEQLFNQVYRGNFHLTLQTCIENEDSLSWGRLFILAHPAGIKFMDTLKSSYISI